MRQSQRAGVAAEETAEFENLETVLAELPGKIRCLRRAASIMTLLAGLAMAGLCYCTVFLPDFPRSFAEFLMSFAVRFLCALGIASLTCLLAFCILHFLYRTELERKREIRRLYLIGM